MTSGKPSLTSRKVPEAPDFMLQMGFLIGIRIVVSSKCFKNENKSRATVHWKIATAAENAVESFNRCYIRLLLDIIT